MNNQNLIVPFGKYKGKPIDVLAQDYEYCDWLLQQGWLQEKYGNVYTIIVNNFGEPTETPEHNKMQYECMKKENSEHIIGLFGIYKDATIELIEPEVLGTDVFIEFKHNIRVDEYGELSCHEQVLIELKPCVGDDYPSILRQMKINRERFISKNKWGRPPFCLLVYGKYNGVGITEEEFRDFFKSCGFLTQKAWW